MTNFEFHRIFSLLGKNMDDHVAKDFFDFIHSDYKDFFIIHEPEEGDIKNESINWKCYDSEELGIVIEVIGEIVASVSFSRGGTFYNEPQEVHTYPYPLYNDLKLGTRRKEIRVKYGAPRKEGDYFDQ